MHKCLSENKNKSKWAKHSSKQIVKIRVKLKKGEARK